LLEIPASPARAAADPTRIGSLSDERQPFGRSAAGGELEAVKGETSDGSVRADVAIVGAGVIGCALARELAVRGLDVVVIERGHPGAEASSAAAGLLAPQAEALCPGPFFDLTLLSRSLYPAWVEELSAETGLPVGYNPCGILRVAFGDGGRLLRDFGWQTEARLSLEVKEAAAVSAMTDGRISGEIREGLFFRDEAIVDSARLTQALARSGEMRGVRFLAETAARRFLLENRICRGVETDRGPVEADRVVNAAGAWAGFDSALPFAIPIQPVRGQMVELKLVGRELPTVVQSDEVYLVPRKGGSVLAGATVEHVGFRNEVTARGVLGLIAAAIRLLPDLSEASFVRAWAGLRPGTPDGWPILGASPVPGLYLATGHFRNGILLAPVTARLLADAVTGSHSRDLEPFSVERFSRSRSPEGFSTPPP
jgi:glycine oxidase